MRDNLFVLLCDFYQTDEIRRTVLSLIDKPNIIYIPFATGVEYRKDVAKKDFFCFYGNDGFVEYIGTNEATEHHKRLIKNSNVIAFGPGDIKMIFDELGTSELLYRIKDRINSNERLVLVGQSAGAIYLCGYGNTHFYLDDDGKLILFNRPCLELMKNTDVVPHAEFFESYLIKVKTAKTRKKIFGLKEGSAVLLHKNKIEKIGHSNVLVYEDDQIKEWDEARNPEQD